MNWKSFISNEAQKMYFKDLLNFISIDRERYDIYPASRNVFRIFREVDVNKIKVVILGQDPYHGPNQANGYAFSVPYGVVVPPSLRNIYKELYTDVGAKSVYHGDLSVWVAQGVFLLNTVLTVRKNEANSHAEIGWEIFTDRVIACISDELDHVVFMLWGNNARKAAPIIDENKHLVLQAQHPSPLAQGKFFGCKHFSKCNSYLELHNILPINWQLNEA